MRPSAATGERVLTGPFLVLFASTLAYFIAGGIAVPVSPEYAEDRLRANPTEVGFAIAIYSVAALAFRPVVGWASDRFGRRPVLLIGAAVAALAFVAHLAAVTLPAFVAVRAFFGVGEAFFFVAAVAMASDLAPAARRGEAISYFSLAIYGGLAVGPWIGETLVGIGSYPLAWLGGAAITTLGLLLALAVRETGPDVSPGGAPTARIAAGRQAMRLIHPAGLLPGALIFLGVFGMAGFLAFVPVYVDEVGLSSSVPLAIYAVLVIALRIVGARLPDRLGAARLSGAALLATAAGLAVIGLVPNAAGLLAGTAVMSVGIAFTFPALVALAVSRVPAAERGTVVGTTTVFLDLAFGFAPMALGAIASQTGYGPTFLVSAALAAAGWVLLLRTRSSLRPVDATARATG